MPITEPQPNLVFLRKILEQTEYITAKVNKINDDQQKLELLIGEYSSTISLLRQKIIKIENIQDKLNVYHESRWF
tara:strand:+ start:5856 stop:6080 length:225 start_codon:yes stop_codon:yes gene_type:complete